MAESLCRCAHLSSDHEVVTEWTPELLSQYGSPCNRCNATPDLERTNLYCRGFAEWPISEMPLPGSYPARVLGCICPVGVNERREAEKLQPVYTPGCAVHDWVCKRAANCVHDFIDGSTYTRSHVGVHGSCEHCTIPRIACEACGKVWSDWRVQPYRVWYLQQAERPNPLPWRCDTCHQT